MSIERPGSGRGTTANPTNRYEPLAVEPEPVAPGEEPPAPTLFFRDASRTVLAENSSPDVGFRFSLNPYRGCEHGCSYCLAPATPVLHADLTWRPLGDVRVGDELVGFDERPEPGGTRRLRRSVVRDVWWSRRPTTRLVTAQADVVTTPDHRWLRARAARWACTHQLAPGGHLRHLAVTDAEPLDDDYRAGYLAGVALGAGTLGRGASAGRPTRAPLRSSWRVALADREPLARVVAYLARLGIAACVRPLVGGPPSPRPLESVEVRAGAALEKLRPVLLGERSSRAYRRGFVAGAFDAAGRDGDCPRVGPGRPTALERVRTYARALGLRCDLDRQTDPLARTLRLVGDRLRFFTVCRPALTHTRDRLFDRPLDLDPEPVVALEAGPVADVVDVTTSTGTFYAAGLATHNCYARPSHEYLGFSAGLDFERKIMVKDDAPELLRRHFLSPRWEPQVVALSGNTDCYQPVERRLGITRRCLEVFVEFRNPVSAITKSALVARDADLFAALAARGAAHVMCSVTTLDRELARRLEPRAATPERRLEAMATLAAAGVPVGVMIGPVIPGLNDSEIPRILAAAADAGASAASWVLLRLAKPIDEIFTGWLAEHYPDRQARVLHRIRDTRAGRITDGAFGRRMRGTGLYAEQIAALFAAAARKHGLDRGFPPLSAAAFRRPPAVGDQLRLL